MQAGYDKPSNIKGRRPYEDLVNMSFPRRRESKIIVDMLLNRFKTGWIPACAGMTL